MLHFDRTNPPAHSEHPLTIEEVYLGTLFALDPLTPNFPAPIFLLTRESTRIAFGDYNLDGTKKTTTKIYHATCLTPQYASERDRNRLDYTFTPEMPVYPLLQQDLYMYLTSAPAPTAPPAPTPRKRWSLRTTWGWGVAALMGGRNTR